MRSFANVDQIQFALQEREFRLKVDRFFGHLPVGSLEYWVALSAMGSTFRSYRRNQRYTPSSLYRRWAVEWIGDGSRVNQAADGDFSSLHCATVTSFGSYWQEKDGTELTYAQSRKLPDLLFRHLVMWQGLKEGARTWLLWEAHVPLDKYTLTAVSIVANKKYPKLVPKRPTMGCVDKRSYGLLQNIIRETCKNICPPLHFDALAWNEKHPEIIDQQIAERLDTSRVAEVGARVPLRPLKKSK